MNLNAKKGAFSLALIAASINLANAQALEEIVVTAEKRTTDLQDTAISVVTISGEDAIKKGSISMDDMLKDMVGVTVQPIGFGSAVSIRGMSWDLPVDVGESPVSVNFDGTANANVQSSIFGYFDMDRMEVMRGPQGTLYGRNAIAGAVNVVSANPNVEEITGYGLVELGNYSHTRLEGAINLPINDSNAVRLAVSDVDRDGYLSSGAADAVGTAVRGKYMFEPSDDFKAVLNLQHTELGGISPDNHVPLANYDAGEPFLTDTTSPDQEYDFESDKYSATIDVTMGPGVVTFIPSYEESENGGTSFSDPDGPGPQGRVITTNPGGTTKQKTAELRYASLPESDIQWIAGLYWNDKKIVSNQNPNAAFGPTASGDVVQGGGSESAFADVTIPLTDVLRLSLGGRYSSEEVILQQKGLPGTIFYDASSTFDNFTWKAGLEMDVTDEALAYATIATSTRPGGFNLIQIPGVDNSTTFDEEDVTSYELGLKSRWLDQTLQLNGSVYYYDYQNYQNVGFVYEASSDTYYPQFTNASSARNYGAELETITLIGESARINLSVSYLNATFNDDYIAAPGLNLKGETLARSPKWTIKGGLENMFSIGDAGILTTNVSVRWSDDQKVLVEPTPANMVDAYAVIDLNASYEPYEGDWSLNLWVKNADDKVYKLGGGNDSTIPGPPRMYGGSVTYNF